MSITERKLKSGKTVYDNQFMYKGIRYKKGGFETKGKAEDWEIEIKYQVNKKGLYFEPCKKTFLDVWNEYFNLEKDRYAYNTIQTYKTAVNHIKKHRIAKMKIIDIKYNTIQNFFNSVAKVENKGTCENIKKVFGLTFKYAIRNEYIENSPVPYVKNKGKETKDKNKKKTVSYDEFITLCSALDFNKFNQYSIYIALCIGYYTGARKTEILALNKSDIDFENKTITFDKRVENAVREPYIAKMKTETSYDVVPLAEPLEEILEEWFKINPYDKIIAKENGQYFKSSNFNQYIKKIKKISGINFHFHMLRHTYASYIVSNGVDVNIAKKLLRHSNINTTLGIYTHSYIEDEKEALKNVFDQKKEQLPQNYPKMLI